MARSVRSKDVTDQRRPVAYRREHVGFARDLYNGIVLGDYAPRLGLAGALAQIVMGFLPGIGTLCALRDCFADWSYGDRFGFLLNILALVPFLGGFPKAAAVLRAMFHVGHVVHVRRRRGAAQDA
ncbi:MAG TPA: hypothetical protein VGN32_14960 [Ktedonobacterales bacterium]|jgi:hypothetical protein|nr:hypothetical protein [Ktedonobacterales bacterium]